MQSPFKFNKKFQSEFTYNNLINSFYSSSCISYLRKQVPTLGKVFLLSALTSVLLACQNAPTASTINGSTMNDKPIIASDIAKKPFKDNQNTENSERYPEDTSRHEYRLENGLKVIIKEDHRAPVVMTQLWYNVGSSDEPKGKGGISHLLEHMMFKGTHKVSGDDFNRLIAKFGGNHNAFTSYDFTGYYEMFPANRLDLALELEADRLINLQFRSEAFKNEFIKERDVVMEERRQRTDDNPLARSFEKFRKLALPDSPKGQSVIGPMAEISNIQIEDLKYWYNTWYTPNNATLVIVGNVEPETALQSVKKYFAPLKHKTLPTRPAVSQTPMRGYQQKTIYENVNVPTLLMAFNVPTLTSAQQAGIPEKEAYDLLMLQYVMDGGMAARFEKNLVREKGILASIMSHYSLFERGDGLFLIQATPREGVTLRQAEEAILNEINGLKTANISTKEIERARNNIVKGYVFSQDSMSGQANLIGSMQSRGLDDRLITLLPQKVAHINSSDINLIAQKYLVEQNLTVMHIMPK